MVKKTVKKAKGYWKRTEGYRSMLFVALIFDLLSAIPWVGMIFSFVGYATLWLWMEIDGMSPGFSKKARHNAKKIGSVAGEFIAGTLGFGIVPGILIWAYFVIAEHSQEVAEKEQRQLKATQKKLVKQKQHMDEQVREGNKKIQSRTNTSAYIKIK